MVPICRSPRSPRRRFLKIAGTTFGVSLLAGLMIVPATFAALGSGDAVAQNSGPSLMFIILPQVFENLGGAATIIGVVFFVLVLFAALTSSLSLVETCTSIMSDGAGWSRKRSLIVTIVYVTLMGVLVNLGYSSLSFIQPMGEGSSILDLLDFISNSVMMPIAALLTCVFVGWIIKPKRSSTRCACRLVSVWPMCGRLLLNTSRLRMSPWLLLVAYRRSDHGSVQHVADQLPARLRGLLASFLFAYLAIGARRAGLFLFS